MTQPTITPERQAELLDEAIMRAAMSGRRLIARSGNHAIVELSSKPNHVLHAILSLLTLGLWLLIWLIVASSSGSIRQTLMVDEYGRTWLDVGGSWQPF